MVTLSKAGLATGVAQLVLREGAQAGKWHMTEAAGSSPLICWDSLLAARKEGLVEHRDVSKEKEQ